MDFSKEIRLSELEEKISKVTKSSRIKEKFGESITDVFEEELKQINYQIQKANSRFNNPRRV